MWPAVQGVQTGSRQASIAGRSVFSGELTRTGDVIVVTFRSDREKAIADLEKHRIRFTDVVLVNSFDQKAEVIAERQISFYIDDQHHGSYQATQKCVVPAYKCDQKTARQ